jgi:hypothetical protein
VVQAVELLLCKHEALSSNCAPKIERFIRKFRFIGQAWWLTLVISATREADIEGSLSELASGKKYDTIFEEKLTAERI